MVAAALNATASAEQHRTAPGEKIESAENRELTKKNAETYSQHLGKRKLEIERANNNDREQQKKVSEDDDDKNNDNDNNKTSVAAVEIDENGVRKSKRSAKPKVLFDDADDYNCGPTYPKPYNARRKKQRNHHHHHHHHHLTNNNKNDNENNTTLLINKNNSSSRNNNNLFQQQQQQSVAPAAGPTKEELNDMEDLKVKNAFVGRKVDVFWHGEQEFHRGLIVKYDEVIKRHRVKYEEATKDQNENNKEEFLDEEMLDFINVENDKLTWVDEKTTTTNANMNRNKDDDDSKETTTTTITPTAAVKIVPRISLPAPGKVAEYVSSQLPESWPRAGQYVWGRVKGHGWWPGVCKGKSAADVNMPSSSRNISFFDDSSARCSRADLVPYRPFFNLLEKAKPSKAFEFAVKKAKESAEKSFTEKLKKRVMKKADGFAEIREKHAERQEELNLKKKQQLLRASAFYGGGGRKGTSTTSTVAAQQKNRGNNNNSTMMMPFDMNENSSAARLARLGQQFDALKDRVAPLAIAASKTLRKQLRNDRFNASGDIRSTIITERERVVLLEELETLKSFLTVAGGKHLEIIDPKDPETIAMFGYDDDFDNQIANCSFMTEDVFQVKGAQCDRLDDPDVVSDDEGEDNTAVDDDAGMKFGGDETTADMISDLGLFNPNPIVEKEEEETEDEGNHHHHHHLDPTPLRDLLSLDKHDNDDFAITRGDENNNEQQQQQPKTPHYPTHDDDDELLLQNNNNKTSTTSEGDRTERNDSEEKVSEDNEEDNEEVEAKKKKIDADSVLIHEEEEEEA